MKPICKRIAKVEQRIHQTESLSWRVTLRRHGYDPQAVLEAGVNHVVKCMQAWEETVDALKRENGTKSVDFDSEVGQVLVRSRLEERYPKPNFEN